MRKGFLVCLALFLIFPVFSQKIPESLFGIWEGKDRFVFFEQIPTDENPELVLLLKEYYGWYLDRTVEPEEYAKRTPRTINNGTTKTAEKADLEIIEGINTSDCWEGLIKIIYSKRQYNYIPTCVINSAMYLDYYIKDSEISYFYKGGIVSKGITIAQQIVPENIACFVIDGDNAFNIRYWKSDMDYSSEKASFTYNGKSYSIPKHIVSGDTLYSCVSGRSKRIRNIQPPESFKEKNAIWNNDNTIFALDKEPYLMQLADKKTFEDLMEIVRTSNVRRRPYRDPVFPPKDLDWHWELIDYLERDNQIIQAVRERQRAFGPRAKDIQ